MSHTERKTRALLEEAAKLAETPALAPQNLSEPPMTAVEAPSAPVSAATPMPDFNEPPPFTDDDAPPLDDEYPIPSPEPVVKSVPKIPEKAAEKVEKKHAANTSAPTREVAPEEWEAAVAKMADIDFVVGTMLHGSTARTDGGRLVIRSSNRMLVENVKGDELTRVEGEISQALGFAVHLSIEAEKSEENAASLSNLERFLNKARELGVEVNIKNQ